MTESSVRPADAPESSALAPPGRMAAAVAGVVAAALVLGLGHLLAVFIDPAASSFYALGAATVDLTPEPLKAAAIRRFGDDDKLALFVVMGVVMFAAAAAAGVLERRRPLGSVLLAASGVVTVAAALSRPTATLWFALPTSVAVLTGITVLRLLVGVLVRYPAAADRHGDSGTLLERRGFLVLAGAVGATAAATFAAGRYLGAALRDIAADRARFVVPAPRSPAAAIDPRVELPIEGVTRFVTPADRFYRVDTALRPPALTAADWRLRIHGMVERDIEFDLGALRDLTPVERIITLTCVSNEVGGNLAGTAVWTGYPLAELLARAGPRPEADMLLSRSIDGFTASTPLAAILDGRDALLAVGMNGAPLPVEHGYPARLVVPGLYGYVSATKWVVDLEITRFDRARAYWTERGWAERAPIETAARIDVPAAFATLPAGTVTVAGVAWAQRRGIVAVEVQVDDRPWESATLAGEYSHDTWRQWYWRWDAAPGMHTLRVRATDGTGAVQTEERTPPFPDGSTGRHQRVVTVR